MNLDTELRNILSSVLGAHVPVAGLTDESPLLGAIPELDSMAVVSLMTQLEESFGFSIADDEISGETFERFGTLKAFVAGKLA